MVWATMDIYAVYNDDYGAFNLKKKVAVSRLYVPAEKNKLISLNHFFFFLIPFRERLF